jgi:hypothetical protein
MKTDPSQIRQRIRRLEDSLGSLVAQLLAERGPLRRGSFVTLHRKCGKATCHCAHGPGHPAPYLSTRHEGRTRLFYLTREIRDQVAEEAGRYRAFRQRRAVLAQRMRAILTSVDELAQALENPEPLVGKKGKAKGQSRGRRRSARSD